MPMYDYKCKKCGNVYEVLYKTQSAVEKEEPEEKCPKCDSKKKERQVSKGTGFILNGTGWHKKHYG